MRYQTAPARVIEFLYLGRLQWLYDDRIIGEYREVLSRPKFSSTILPGEVDELLTLLDRAGEYVLPGTDSIADLPVLDHSDIPFIEVAAAGAADCIITGNIRHFLNIRDRIRVLTPAECLELLCG